MCKYAYYEPSKKTVMCKAMKGNSNYCQYQYQCPKTGKMVVGAVVSCEFAKKAEE